MSANAIDFDGRRRNCRRAKYELAKLFRMWRDGLDDEGNQAPANRNRREGLSPYSTIKTPRMGEMSNAEIEEWAHRISCRDAERSINQTNESTGRARRRASEAA